MTFVLPNALLLVMACGAELKATNVFDTTSPWVKRLSPLLLFFICFLCFSFLNVFFLSLLLELEKKFCAKKFRLPDSCEVLGS